MVMFNSYVKLPEGTVLSLLQQGTCETGDYGWTRMKYNIFRSNESIADRVAKTINMPDINIIKYRLLGC